MINRFGITEDELNQLIYDLEEAKEDPRSERHIDLKFDEINYILETIKYYEENNIG